MTLIRVPVESRSSSAIRRKQIDENPDMDQPSHPSIPSEQQLYVFFKKLHQLVNLPFIRLIPDKMHSFVQQTAGSSCLRSA